MTATAARSEAPTLSQASVERLRSDRSADARAETAARVATLYAAGALSERERQHAVEILERLARDLEQQVRQALCDHLKHCPFLPASMAKTLARDVESVALPMIRYSTVLSDADLIEIIREGNQAKQLAVAERDRVSASVSDALVDTGRKPVVGVLLGNHGADIAEGAFAKVVERFGGDAEIQVLLVERPSLPASVTERLISQVSDVLRERLVSNHGFPAELADEIAMHGRERALAQAVGSQALQAEMEGLVHALYEAGRLTPTFLLRVLSSGDLALFQAGLAARAGVPGIRAAATIVDDRVSAFGELYRQAGLPPGLYAAFRIALGVAREARRANPDGWSREDRARLVQDLVLAYEDLCPEDLENVIAQLWRRCGKQPPQGARRRRG